jgi:CBS domain-containing protein
MTRGVMTIEATKTLADAVKTMRDANIGCLVVVEQDQTPIGMFTERDLVRKIADKGDGALGLAMEQVMTKPLSVISPSATIWDAVAQMGRADIRRLPVVESGRLIGILTERDVFRLLLFWEGM